MTKALIDLFDDDVPAAAFDLVDFEIVAGLVGPFGDVLHGAGMIDRHDQDVADFHRGQRLLGLDEGDGAGFTQAVESLFGHLFLYIYRSVIKSGCSAGYAWIS